MATAVKELARALLLNDQSAEVSKFFETSRSSFANCRNQLVEGKGIGEGTIVKLLSIDNNGQISVGTIREALTCQKVLTGHVRPRDSHWRLVDCRLPRRSLMSRSADLLALASVRE